MNWMMKPLPLPDSMHRIRRLDSDAFADTFTVVIFVAWVAILAWNITC